VESGGACVVAQLSPPPLLPLDEPLLDPLLLPDELPEEPLPPEPLDEPLLLPLLEPLPVPDELPEEPLPLELPPPSAPSGPVGGLTAVAQPVREKNPARIEARA
jgi:hypothetical protein